MHGTVTIFRTFVFITQSLDSLPRIAFFLPLEELNKPIGKAILIKRRSAEDLTLEFYLGLLKTDCIKDWPHRVTVDRSWARSLWSKCGFPKGSRAAFETKLRESSDAFMRCQLGNALASDNEEKLFLVLGTFWAYWQREQHKIFFKNRADDVKDAGGRSATGKILDGNNLWNRAKWAGFIPLTPEEEQEVEQMVGRADILAIYEDLMGQKPDFNIDIKVDVRVFRDYFIEKVLGRNLSTDNHIFEKMAWEILIDPNE